MKVVDYNIQTIHYTVADMPYGGNTHIFEQYKQLLPKLREWFILDFLHVLPEIKLNINFTIP